MPPNMENKSNEPRDEAGAGPDAPAAGSLEVEKIVNAVILTAVNLNASDVHMEPFAGPAGEDPVFALRFRVDGILTTGPITIPWSFRNAVIAKIKIMSGSMEDTVRNFPQTGRMILLVKGGRFEIQIRTLPTIHGEACTLRVRDTSKEALGIEQLGFLPDTLDDFLGLFKDLGGRKNTGLVLVCGRADSGRTSALYAVLNRIKRPDIRIITAECPVRRAVDGVIQVPVDPSITIGRDRRFVYATALMYIDRFEPDVVMTGELGDSATAVLTLETAARSLAFTTLYVGSAHEALVRLQVMGLPPLKVAEGVKAILALSLARRLCERCKTARPATAEERAIFQANGVDFPAGSNIFGPPPTGSCTECRNIGFKGRIGLHELLVIDEDIRAAISRSDSKEAMLALTRRKVTRSLAQDGLEKVKRGLTTIGEAFAATTLDPA